MLLLTKLTGFKIYYLFLLNYIPPNFNTFFRDVGKTCRLCFIIYFTRNNDPLPILQETWVTRYLWLSNYTITTTSLLDAFFVACSIKSRLSDSLVLHYREVTVLYMHVKSHLMPVLAIRLVSKHRWAGTWRRNSSTVGLLNIVS